jgi:hypothetical protein
MIKVTPQMGSRWVKGAFLALLGIIILIYADKFVEELRLSIQDSTDVAFDWTWDLLKILLWVLVAWLFVDAALTIALSFSEHRYSLSDVMKRLQRIEKKLGIVEPKPAPRVEEDEEVEEEKPVETEEEIPPPPKE